MKRIFICVIVLLLAAINVQAQKIDERLTSLLPSSNNLLRAKGGAGSMRIDTVAVKRKINVRFNNDGTVKSFSTFAMLKEGVVCPTEQLQKLGVEIREEIGRMLILNVPAESLLDLGGIDEIESVGADEKNQIMNDKGREKSKVSEVATPELAFSNDLPQAYTGKGVLVGVVDEGIDFSHAAFRNADGSTRVKMAMMKAEDEINIFTEAEDIGTLESDLDNSSHGTHVAGIAAGSIIEGLDLQGMAPEADLMLCGLGENYYDSDMVYAIKKMMDFADEQGKPCVINISLGHMTDFLDGEGSEILQSLKEYYKTEDNRKGRIIVFASGNAGVNQSAIYTTLPAADSEGYNLKTVLGESTVAKYDGVTVKCYDTIEDIFYNIDGSELDVDVYVVDVNNGNRYTLEEKPLYTSSDEEVTELPMIKDKFYRNGKYRVKLELNDRLIFHEPNLRLAFHVKSTEGKTFRAIDERQFSNRGFLSCGWDDYVEGQGNGAFNVHISGDEVIGVGAYFSKGTYTNIEGNIYGYDEDSPVDRIVRYSSWGTDDNGINRPDVIAPGALICSAYNNYDRNKFDKDGNPKKWLIQLTNAAELFGRNHYYGVDEGTSMAAPNVAGIIALWLQANPYMTYDDVRAVIKETSYNDEYTTNPELIPSGNTIQAGVGKIDALKGLQVITSSSDINTVGADGHREATPATMYDADDNCYNAFGQRVDRKMKGLVMYKGKIFLNR